MQKALYKSLRKAAQTWLMLTLDILGAAVIYASVKTSNLPNPIGLVITCICGAILIFTDLLISHKTMDITIRINKSNANKTKNQQSTIPTKDVYVSTIVKKSLDQIESDNIKLTRYILSLGFFVLSILGSIGIGLVAIFQGNDLVLLLIIPAMLTPSLLNVLIHYIFKYSNVNDIKNTRDTSEQSPEVIHKFSER